MEKLIWHPFIYNGLETNIECTECGKFRRKIKDWMNKSKKAVWIQKCGEINFECLKTTNGYYSIKVQLQNLKSRSFYVHQILTSVFLHHNIDSKIRVVDHIDGNRLNNNINNLRVVTHRENTSFYFKNVKKNGLPIGVYLLGNKYRAQIRINKIKVHLGLFTNINEANSAYLNKLQEINSIIV